MNLLLDLDEGLPIEIHGNMSYLPNKLFLREAILLYLLNLFTLFDCLSNNVLYIETRRQFSPRGAQRCFLQPESPVPSPASGAG